MAPAPPVSLFDGQFHHIAGTYDGALMKVYLDGGLVSSIGATGTIVSSSTAVLLGASLNNGAKAFFQQGMLDEARIYNQALTIGDVQVLASAGSSSPVPQDGLASVSYDQSTNRISTAGWEYDAAGNQTRAQRADGSWQRYVYDAAGRLVKVQNDSSVTQIVHTYGASNHRFIEQVGDETSNQRTYYAWAGDSVIAEYEETPSAATTPEWLKSYVYLGGRLLATIAPNGASERVEYQHPDRLGTRLVTNNQDTTSFEQVSLPFGTALDAESSGTTKRRFTSYDRSSVTGLDYAVNRHYDPLQGRFTQVDPIGMASVSLTSPQTLNLYAYCANDPINHTDASGLGFFSWLGSIFKKIVAAFVAAVVAVVVVLVTGGNVHAALTAGRAVFRGAFQVYPGWQPSGGWGRTPPTFGNGPTLAQILGQTEIGRRLTPDKKWFLTPGIAGNGIVGVTIGLFSLLGSPCDSVWPNTLRFDKGALNHITNRHIRADTHVKASKFIFQNNVWGLNQKQEWVMALGRYVFDKGKSKAFQADNKNWVIVYGTPTDWFENGRAFWGIGTDRDRWDSITNVVTLILKGDCQEVVSMYPGLPSQIGNSTDPRIGGSPPRWR